MPLLTFDTERPGAFGLGPPPSYAAAHDDEEEKDAPPRKWYHYLPTLARDPGRVKASKPGGDSGEGEGEELDLTQALLSMEEDVSSTGQWCRKCWAPKPERAHQ
ncbi:hypothetical protein PHLCEN_2v13602 [Hermanssonia centrifuga]|uniref:Uncharacterized protein n=1 Tax=Hermanssonia centrifuga TaxID=98765 RepID=A0A2R6NDX6_9APHY|nr:hypothetical protein PHLCEN_2v13602 [Hermanssonia centrifuga]